MPSWQLTADDFAELYADEAERLLGFFMRRTYDPNASVDLLAETFAAAFEGRAGFRPHGENKRSAITAWLYGIARHRLSDYFRAGVVEKRALTRVGVERRPLTTDEYERIEELAASAELRDSVANALDALPADQGEAIRLRIVEERPYADLAQRLGITEATARARVSRGLRALRKTLRPQESTHA